MNNFEDSLQRQLFRQTCPDPPILGEFELGLLPGAQQTAVAAHVVDCPHCSAELADLQRQMAQPLFEGVQSAEKPTLLTKAKLYIIDLLAPDNGSLQPQMVLRSGEDEAQVQSHQVGDYLITLSWQSDVAQADHFTLIADITSVHDDVASGLLGWTAHLWQNDKLFSQHPIGIDGDLLIDKLPAATYHLILTGDNIEAHLQNLAIS